MFQGKFAAAFLEQVASSCSDQQQFRSNRVLIFSAVSFVAYLLCFFIVYRWLFVALVHLSAETFVLYFENVPLYHHIVIIILLRFTIKSSYNSRNYCTCVCIVLELPSSTISSSFFSITLWLASFSEVNRVSKLHLDHAFQAFVGAAKNKWGNYMKFNPCFYSEVSGKNTWMMVHFIWQMNPTQFVSRNTASALQEILYRPSICQRKRNCATTAAALHYSLK